MNITIEQTPTTITIAEKKLGYSLVINRSTGTLEALTEPEECSQEELELFLRKAKSTYNKHRNMTYVDDAIDKYLN
jgi:hypothetical protein